MDNDDVLRRVTSQPRSDIVRVKRLNLAKHVLRLPEERPARERK